MSRSRNKGFSLIEVAVAVALLSIATAFSLPRINRLAIHATVDAPHHDAPSAYPQHPAPGTGRVLIDWGGFATTAEPSFHALTKADAPSGKKDSLSGDAPQSAKSAAASTNLETNGR
ncbi:MAG: type II secretion system protein [Steroidobacteraceae bacterium]